MSRDTTGIYSAWATESIACLICNVNKGEKCKIDPKEDHYSENGTHFSRTEDAPPLPSSDSKEESDAERIDMLAEDSAEWDEEQFLRFLRLRNEYKAAKEGKKEEKKEICPPERKLFGETLKLTYVSREDTIYEFSETSDRFKAELRLLASEFYGDEWNIEFNLTAYEDDDSTFNNSTFHLFVQGDDIPTMESELLQRLNEVNVKISEMIQKYSKKEN